MRSLSRGVVIGALALPLAFAGAGLAAAHTDGAEHHHPNVQLHNVKFDWDWKFVHKSQENNTIENSGIIG